MPIHNPELFQAYRFRVEVNGAKVGGFTQFSGIKTEVQTIQVRSGNDIRGVQEYVPVLTRYAPVTLSKGVIRDNAFLEWLLTASAGPFAGMTGGNMYRTLDVIAVGADGSDGVRWSLIDALPIGYEITPMDGMRNEVLTESMTFAIIGVSRTAASAEPGRMGLEDVPQSAAGGLLGMMPEIGAEAAEARDVTDEEPGLE